MKKEYRICIIGNSGSGKSTLAKELGRALDLPVYHLDRHMLRQDFARIPIDQYHQKHFEFISGGSWIIDGNFSKVLAERVDRATLVVFLNVSRVITLPRIIARAYRQSHPEGSIPEGANGRHLSWSFLHWVVTYNRRKWIHDLKAHCSRNNVPFLILNKAPIKCWLIEIKKALSSNL